MLFRSKIIQFKFCLFFLLIFLNSNNLFAKPRCEIFYDKVYNKGAHRDVSLVKNENQKSIGIRLQKFWNEKKVIKLKDGKEVKIPGWELIGFSTFH